jgi:hypothetical protein
MGLGEVEETSCFRLICQRSWSTPPSRDHLHSRAANLNPSSNPRQALLKPTSVPAANSRFLSFTICAGLLRDTHIRPRATFREDTRTLTDADRTSFSIAQDGRKQSTPSPLPTEQPLDLRHHREYNRVFCLLHSLLTRALLV